jgi:hypothetical protein
MQQLVILLVISFSSTCFGRLYVHRQEVRLRFHCLWFLFSCNCCEVGESAGKLCALCGVGCLTQACQPTLQLHNCYNRTETIGSENAVWPPEDGRKDARNMLRNNWLPIKSLIVASSWNIVCLKFTIVVSNWELWIYDMGAAECVSHWDVVACHWVNTRTSSGLEGLGCLNIQGQEALLNCLTFRVKALWFFELPNGTDRHQKSFKPSAI